MSDGPHRSLPLKRHWKKVAERAATPAYALSELTDALPRALVCELREAPVKQVVNLLCGQGQLSLFNSCIEQLEALRSTCRGSIAGTALIDCAIEANADGFNGVSAVNKALTNTLESLARGFGHSIEEHFQREQPWSILNIRTRLREASAKLSYATLASDIISGKATKIAKVSIAKRAGIDQGPLL